jgi:hypothetical protein
LLGQSPSGTAALNRSCTNWVATPRDINAVRKTQSVLFAQLTDDLPDKEDRHLYGADASIGAFGLSPPDQARLAESLP